MNRLHLFFTLGIAATAAACSDDEGHADGGKRALGPYALGGARHGAVDGCRRASDHRYLPAVARRVRLLVRRERGSRRATLLRARHGLSAERLVPV